MGPAGSEPLVVPDLTVPHAAVPHGVEDLRTVAVGEHQHRPVGLDRRQEVPVLPVMSRMRTVDRSMGYSPQNTSAAPSIPKVVKKKPTHARSFPPSRFGGGLWGGQSTRSICTAAFFRRKAGKVAGSP